MEETQLHFIVADDDEASRETVVEFLQSLGYQNITAVKNGAEALEALKRDSSINFIISDWDMPVMNGLGLLQAVRGDAAFAHFPFLIITAPVSHEADKVIMAGENEASAYLIKPFNRQSFKDKLEQVIASYTKAEELVRRYVLVVDDDPDARAMVEEYLATCGFKDVLTMSDGKAALEYLSQNAYKVCLIVSDWEMPQVTGLELLQACKGSPSLRDIPFLMITSQTSMEQMKIIQAGQSDVDQYLLKPFNIAEFRKRIELLMNRSRDKEKTEELVAKALEHVEHGHYQSAKRFLEQAVRQNPHNEVALRTMGDCLAKLNGMEASLPYYRRAVDVNPMNPKTIIKLAYAYEHIGWVDKAIALLTQANQKIKVSAELHFQLGKLYAKKGEGEAAKYELLKALELKPELTEAQQALDDINSPNAKKPKKKK